MYIDNHQGICCFYEYGNNIALNASSNNKVCL